MKTLCGATAIALMMTAPAFADMGGPITLDNEVNYATFDAPEVDIPGFSQINMDEFTTEDLTGAYLYDAKDEWIGEVDAVVMNADGEVSGAVLGVGGWLGIGEKDVLVSFDSLTIKQEADGDEMRVYADVTKDALEALPEFELDS